MTSDSAGALPRAAAGLDRSQLFFWLFLLAAANGLAGIAIGSALTAGWLAAAANLASVSAILWVALAAGLGLAWDARDSEAPRRLDWWVAALVILASLMPVTSASSAALTFLACYAVATAAPRSRLRRAGIVFLAMTGSLLWGRLLLEMFSRPLLDLDALFVGLFLGVEQEGNVIAFADGSGKMVVAAGCSSLQGISLAILFWATINQWFDVPFGRRASLWCVAAVAATVAINVLRMGALAHFPEHFDSIHSGFGWHVAGWTTLAAVAAICVYGARREIFARD